MPSAERKSRACIECFQKKLKCDREIPCSKCVKRSTECLYSHVEKTRKTPQRSAVRLKEMEARLQAMESLAGSTNGAAAQKMIASTSHMTVHPRNTTGIEAYDQLDDLTGPFQLHMFNRDSAPVPWTLINSQGISRQLVLQPLPTMEEVWSLVQEYFESFNSVIPLFHEDDFMERLQSHSTAEPLADIGWWAALNVVLAIACRMRGMRTSRPAELNVKACDHIQNALNIAQDVTLRKPDLLSVQALLGIAIVMQGTPHPRPASIIVAAAVKLSQSLGLHRQSTLEGLSVQKAEQCKRVFWIGYLLDKDFSLQLNQPPIQTDLECDVDLPAEHPIDGLGMITVSNRLGTFNYFRIRVQLAVTQSEMYTTLYSVQSSKLSPSARALAIENQENRLNAWRQSMSLDFRPNSLAQSVAPFGIIHLVILYTTYFNCLTMIHSISFRGEYWTASASTTIEGTLAGDPISIGRAMCLPAARLAVRLVSLLPGGDYACIWMLLHYHVSAVVILLANIIQHPKDPSADSDMGLIEPLLRLLESLSIGHSTEGGEDLQQLQAFCLSLENKARTALENAHFGLLPTNATLGFMPESAQAL